MEVSSRPAESKAISVADVAREFVAYYTHRGGCSNCGGLPHSASCFVGRFLEALALPGPAHLQQHDAQSAALRMALQPSLVSLDEVLAAIRAMRFQADQEITRLLEENAELLTQLSRLKQSSDSASTTRTDGKRVGS